MRPAVIFEWAKLRRSRVVITATALMGLLLPAMGLGFYQVAISGTSGGLAGKAEALLVGEGWIGYLGLVGQIAAVALFVGIGIVVGWSFGREHVDRTFASLFALPVSRGSISAAKFVVLASWLVTVAVLVTIVAVVIGLTAGVGANDTETILAESGGLLAISLTAGALALPMGFVASVGRGYLAAIGAIIVIVAIAQIAVLFGTGGWFPFATPGLLAIAGSEGAPELSALQIALVPALAVAGIWATIVWWRRAEVV